MKKDGGPAFPATRWEQGDTGGIRNDVPMAIEYPGMSLRDFFAGQALIGLSRAYVEQTVDDYHLEDVAVDAYKLADAMLAERDKEEA